VCSSDLWGRPMTRDACRPRVARWCAIAVVVAATWSVATLGANAADEPGGKPERITLAPTTVTRAVGQVQNFTATAHYADGSTRNVTQDVRYRSSDQAVVRTPNAARKRSRVEAVGPGTATISATDPASGVGSADGEGAGNATMTVLGKLERIELAPRAPSRAVGQPQNFTATGFFAGGGTRNLTQHVTYTSSDPNVAVAPNDAGRRSRVEAVAPGSATISATDPATGISSTASGGDAVLTVVVPKSPSPSPAP